MAVLNPLGFPGYGREKTEYLMANVIDGAKGSRTLMYFRCTYLNDH